MPLREALISAMIEPDSAIVKQCLTKAADPTLVAKNRALSLDERAAILLFTAEAPPPSASVYTQMNAALRESREAVEPWRDLIWLLLHALRKLPPAKVPMVMRGCKKSTAELGVDLSAQAIFTWHGFSSTTKTADVMSTFLGESGDRTMWHLQLTEPTARDVSDFSLHPREDEVRVAPSRAPPVCICASQCSCSHHPPTKKRAFS